MIKNCQDSTNTWVYPFDELIMEMFEKREDLNSLQAIHAYIIENKYDYCLVHLLTLISCCIGYMSKLK